jgi:hypothetical protein
MADRVQVEVVLLRGEVIEHEDGRVVEQEITLEGQNLAPVSQGPLGEQANLGERVEHHATGLHPLELRDGHPHRLAELEVGGMNETLCLFRIEAQLGRDELENLDAVEGPTMAGCDRQKLALALGKSDVEAGLSVVHASQ